MALVLVIIFAILWFVFKNNEESKLKEREINYTDSLGNGINLPLEYMATIYFNNIIKRWTDHYIEEGMDEDAAKKQACIDIIGSVPKHPGLFMARRILWFGDWIPSNMQHRSFLRNGKYYTSEIPPDDCLNSEYTIVPYDKECLEPDSGTYSSIIWFQHSRAQYHTLADKFTTWKWDYKPGELTYILTQESMVEMYRNVWFDYRKYLLKYGSNIPVDYYIWCFKPEEICMEWVEELRQKERKQ